MQHGWEGVVLKAMRGKDFTLTVRDVEQVSERYRRVTVTDGGLLAACGPHPAMWIRMWFDDDGRPHQRAYTVVDPDPGAGTFDLEFALHDGVAARWSLAAEAGETIEVTVQGTRFAPPDPTPRHVHLVGDPASLPAINSLLDAFSSTPTTVWLESGHPSDRALPVRAGHAHEVVWVDRGSDAGAGDTLVREVTTAWAPGGDVDPATDWFWIAAEASSTRPLTRHLRTTLRVRKDRISALGYWRAA